MKTETVVLREICDWLHEKEYFFWRSNNAPVLGRSGFTMRALPKYTPRGLPDIMVLHQGRFIALEVKRPGSDEREKNGRKTRAGKLSPEQAEFGAKVTLHNGIYAMVDSVEAVRDMFSYL